MENGSWTIYCIAMMHMEISKPLSTAQRRMVDGLKHLIPDSKQLLDSPGYIIQDGFRMVWENDRIFMKDMPDCIGQICYGPYRNASDSEITEHVGFFVKWITITNDWPEPSPILRKDLGYWS
ncbi:MAG: hypothetical protein ACLTX3_08950 [Lachnospiraceae bacterium]